jgi:hypothetical protein
VGGTAGTAAPTVRIAWPQNAAIARVPATPSLSNIAQRANSLQAHRPVREAAPSGTRMGYSPMSTMIMTRTVLLAFLASTITAHAATTGKRDRPQATRNAVYEYGPRGPNRSYQSGPHTRLYVSKRSWLDGGTEVLPGDRKFTDYAVPPGTSFARGNNNRPLDRQPLYPYSDLGGFAGRIPISW